MEEESLMLDHPLTIDQIRTFMDKQRGRKVTSQ